MKAGICVSLIALATVSSCARDNSSPLVGACKAQFRLDEEYARRDISEDEYGVSQVENVFGPALEMADSPGLTPEESAVTVAVRKIARTQNRDESQLVVSDLLPACRTLLKENS